MLKLYHGNSLKEGCDLALTHRLYVEGSLWLLQKYLENSFLGNPRSNEMIALKFVGPNPVAIAMRTDPRPFLYMEDNELVMAFCHYQHRRKGYGSMCVKAVKRPFVVAGAGGEGSREFWAKLNVTHS